METQTGESENEVATGKSKAVRWPFGGLLGGAFYFWVQGSGASGTLGFRCLGEA